MTLVICQARVLLDEGAARYQQPTAVCCVTYAQDGTVMHHDHMHAYAHYYHSYCHMMHHHLAKGTTVQQRWAVRLHVSYGESLMVSSSSDAAE